MSAVSCIWNVNSKATLSIISSDGVRNATFGFQRVNIINRNRNLYTKTGIKKIHTNMQMELKEINNRFTDVKRVSL